MTVCIGFNLGPCVILVADTRITYLRANGPSFFKDGVQKIERTPGGLITGAGYGNMLDAVKAEMAKPGAVEHTGQTLDIIRAARRRVEQDPGLMAIPAVKDSLAYTSWLITYATAKRKENGDFHELSLRLALSAPQYNYDLGLYPPGSSAILFPTGTEDGQAEELNNYLTADTRVMEDGEPLSEAVGHHIALAVHVVDALADSNDGVSPSFQVGLQIWRHTAISSIVPLDDIGSMTFQWTEQT